MSTVMRPEVVQPESVTRRTTPRRQVKMAIGRVLLHSLVIAGALVLIIPFLWMVSTSLKSYNEVFESPIRWIPRVLQWANYPTALAQHPFGLFFMNSGIVALAVTAANLLLCAMAGYGLSQYTYKGREFLFVLILSTMMLPLEVVMVPLFLITKQFNMLNSLSGLIVPMAVDPFGVFLMRQFMFGIPSSLIEAARIDGAGEFHIFWRIVSPLTRPAMAALGIFTFRETWDAFIWPLIIITEEKLKTVPLGIAMFETSYVTNYHQLMAVATVAIVPMMALFFVMQRAFIRGMAMTGLKD